jgi:hypothetical protein
MTRYTYKLINVPEGDIEVLNEAGADGWQVVNVFEGSYHDDAPWFRVLVMKEAPHEERPRDQAGRWVGDRYGR